MQRNVLELYYLTIQKLQAVVINTEAKLIPHSPNSNRWFVYDSVAAKKEQLDFFQIYKAKTHNQ